MRRKEREPKDQKIKKEKVEKKMTLQTFLETQVYSRAQRTFFLKTFSKDSEERTYEKWRELINSSSN